MNNKDLAEGITALSGLDSAITSEVIACLFEQVIPDALAAGDKVEIRNFGVFNSPRPKGSSIFRRFVQFRVDPLLEFEINNKEH